MRGLSIVLVACAVAAIAPGQASAQDGGYRELIAAAVEEHQARHFEEARALYLRAHAISPNARTERALGMVEYELRQYADAYRYLRASLDDARNPLTPELRGEVERLLVLTEARVGRVRITVTPADARLEIDGSAASLEDGGVVLDLGAHRIVASTESGTATREITIEGGEDLAIAIEVPAGAPVVVTEPTIAEPALEVPPEGGHDLVEEWWFWTVLGVAALAVGGGIAIGVAAYDPGTEAPYPGTTGVIMTLRAAP